MTATPQHDPPQLSVRFVQLQRNGSTDGELHHGALVACQTSGLVLHHLAVAFVDERHELLDISLLRDTAVMDDDGKAFE